MSVDETVESEVTETGSAVDTAVTEDEVVAASAAVDVVTASLNITAIVEPVSPSTKSVRELPVTVWAERVAPDPSII